MPKSTWEFLCKQRKIFTELGKYNLESKQELENGGAAQLVAACCCVTRDATRWRNLESIAVCRGHRGRVFGPSDLFEPRRLELSAFKGVYLEN